MGKAVIEVPDVVRGKFPVAGNGVFLDTGRYNDLFAFFSDHVDAHAPDVAKVLREGRGLRVHIGEDEALVGIHLGGLD